MDPEEIKEMLSKYRVVAVVGLSNTLGRPSHRVAAYLKKHGYHIIPVNPLVDEAVGEKSYKNLLDIPPEIQKTIDIIDIFRKSEDVPPVVEQAIKLRNQFGRPCVIWMQRGIINIDAAKTAQQTGLKVIMDRCIMEDHLHLCRS
ncbi:MAG: CoA-binding protein [Nitrososphaerota archaeon]|jgi:predicted CoA-binding protein|uniref:CoA-binding protein n=1 Tax=Candidatus Bathycorpusculum sp. TaxID=2994959 RepID=UPI00282F3252|nr:CoA-binding protein [Candidatus Termitimicrobium sp.]MCL2431200.1 CoA-binding protein [Candidatus Termitimicrobium sp.]MDR0492326.1 CoA-binding protein [Nitrososphaerota archaeon]